ncbi:UPF0158 family protein [Saccharicrinis sp. FJH2]|uniref:UPF0158 family protein n=1 Tax=Saccharicrinis sp. FJH65 TaxID=3344659 RepID=UPI0035F2AE98
MKPGEAFQIMKDFIEEIDNNSFKENLGEILVRKKPFANFKHIIENSEYREKWFNFKTLKHENYVREILENENIEFE